MVEVTPAQKHLIGWLKVMGVEEDEMIGIMLLMDTPQKRDDLMMWMSKHEEATPSDILGKAMEISKKAKEQDDREAANFLRSTKSLLDQWIKVTGAKRIVITPTQQNLIKDLMITELTEDEILEIMLLMNNEQRQEALILWMRENCNAGSSDILKKAQKISM